MFLDDVCFSYLILSKVCNLHFSTGLPAPRPETYTAIFVSFCVYKWWLIDFLTMFVDKHHLVLGRVKTCHTVVFHRFINEPQSERGKLGNSGESEWFPFPVAGWVVDLISLSRHCIRLGSSDCRHHPDHPPLSTALPLRAPPFFSRLVESSSKVENLEPPSLRGDTKVTLVS